MPDALQVATTLRGDADALLTNDQRIAHRTDAVPVLILDELTGE